MVLLMLVGSNLTYRVKFNDCSKPTNINRMNVKTACENESEDEDSKTELAVLQMIRNQKIKGHKCRVKRANGRFYAGRSHIRGS